MKDRKEKHVLLWRWCQWEGEGHKERVKEGKYGGNYHVLMHENGTMRPVETILRRGERGE
jgi:hypothetical protein